MCSHCTDLRLDCHRLEDKSSQVLGLGKGIKAKMRRRTSSKTMPACPDSQLQLSALKVCHASNAVPSHWSSSIFQLPLCRHSQQLRACCILLIFICNVALIARRFDSLCMCHCWRYVDPGFRVACLSTSAMQCEGAATVKRSVKLVRHSV